MLAAHARTSCVYVRMGMPNARARPKSASFRLFLLSIRRFCGLRSRCRIRCAWQYNKPEVSWCVNFCSARRVRRNHHQPFQWRRTKREFIISTRAFNKWKSERERGTTATRRHGNRNNWAPVVAAEACRAGRGGTWSRDIRAVKPSIDSEISEYLDSKSKLLADEARQPCEALIARG